MLPTMGSLGFEPHSGELGRERNSHIRVIQCRIWTRRNTVPKTVENSVNMPWMTHPSCQGSPLKIRVGSKEGGKRVSWGDRGLLVPGLLCSHPSAQGLNLALGVQRNSFKTDCLVYTLSVALGPTSLFIPPPSDLRVEPSRSRAVARRVASINFSFIIDSRAKFSEITAQSARRAVQNLAQPDRRISDAVDVRQELDLRIGAAFTRFQTLRLQRVFPENLSNLVISYGSCQFPTMGFVVERYKAVQNFIPEPFWKIKVTHTISDLSVEFSWKRVRLFDQTACQVLYDICMERTLATVEKVQSKPKSKRRPLPLDTVELEKLASRKLKLSAKVTMQIAEKLYTKGLISYPRTETNIFPKELNLRSLVEMHTADHNWGEFANRVLESGPNPRVGKKSDQAHPPIHPTKYTCNLEGDEWRVYEFVVRHFLACCSKDAEGLETVVDIDINEEKFVASGLMIIARNYLDVYPYDKWSGKEIHVYQQGQTFEPTNIEMTEGTTSAPNLLTEADLIALMEKHGIGTDATHADHIEKIKSRLYVGLENDNYFVPGQLGMGLVEGYDSMGFPMSKPNLRAELEADLKRVCEGTRNPAEVLREQLAKYKDVFRIAIEQVNKAEIGLETKKGSQAGHDTSMTVVVFEGSQAGHDTSMTVVVFEGSQAGHDTSMTVVVFEGSQAGHDTSMTVVVFEGSQAGHDTSMTVVVFEGSQAGHDTSMTVVVFEGSQAGHDTSMTVVVFEGSQAGHDTSMTVVVFEGSQAGHDTSMTVVVFEGSQAGHDTSMTVVVFEGSQAGHDTSMTVVVFEGSQAGHDTSMTVVVFEGSQAGHDTTKLDTALGQYLEEQAQPPGDSLVTLEETPEPAMKCPSCGLDMVLKTKRDGTSKYLSCMAYPQCRSALWFPRNVEGLTVSEQSCPQCGPDVKKLNFKFRCGSMIPYCEDNYTGCVGGCDLQFLEMLDMRPLMGRPRYISPLLQQKRVKQQLDYGSMAIGPPGSPPVNRGGGVTASFADSGMGSSLGGGRSSSSNTSHRGASYSSTRGRGSQASIKRSSTDMGGWSMTDNNVSGASSRVPRLLGGGDGSSDHENKVVCNCNLDAILLTVRKDGPNQGRKFYKCNKNQGQGCNFFMWADSVEENRQDGGRPLAAANNVPRQPPARQGGNIAEGGDDVLCRCEEPTKRLTVQKEGPNKGRTFYACAKGQNNGCNFFQWGDEVPPRDSNWSGGDNGMSGGRGGWTRGGEFMLRTQLFNFSTDFFLIFLFYIHYCFQPVV
uniref:DNA topoisomerase n=1 Tax=Timema tahoe TaxID=61484 RepID=A0A7R9IBX5_9NEOP|nr:unnamed protein product [Timema tahoe]